MQYTRPMIDLVYEIRRRVEAGVKPGVKMANPDLLSELADYHHRSRDTITKTLIKELLSLAGEQWLELLNPAQATQPIPSSTPPKQVVKVYRGQTMLTNAAHTPSDDLALVPMTSIARKPARIYRGQPVE